MSRVASLRESLTEEQIVLMEKINETIRMAAPVKTPAPVSPGAPLLEVSDERR